MEDICRNIFKANSQSIKIKKEGLAVKNLVNIYNATLKLSSEKGFSAMSLRDLCRETGLSMGALYSYFSTKEDLLNIIQEQGQQFIAGIMNQYINAVDSVEEKLRIAIRIHLYLSEIMPQWFIFFFMEARYMVKAEQKKAIASELATEQIFINILEMGNQQKIFSIDDVTMTASVMKPILQDWYLKRWKYTRRKISVDDYADFIIQFIEKTLRR
ncbi:MAG: TetR/AcrR family transcriptional regulator [Desulfobacterium sp.]|nr:TetR/AcrR family transcriptional regulator [Desulfobacterium sp.]